MALNKADSCGERMQLGVTGLGGHYLWTVPQELKDLRALLDSGWRPGNFWSPTHSGTRQSIPVEAMPELPTTMICGPDGGSVFVNGEFQWSFERDLRRQRPWRVVRAGEHIHDWIGPDKPVNLLHRMLTGDSPFNSHGKPTKKMDTELWPAGSALHPVGTLDCDGYLQVEGRTFSADPSLSEIVGMLDLRILGSMLKKRGWGDATQGADHLELTLTTAVPELVAALETTSVLLTLEMSAEDARTVLEQLDAPPKTCTLKIDGPLSALEGSLSESIPRLIVRTPTVDVDDVRALPSQAQLEVQEMPSADVVAYVLDHGPSVCPPGRWFGLGHAVIRGPEYASLLSQPWAAPICVEVKPHEQELPTELGAALMQRLPECGELRIKPQGDHVLELSGTLPLPSVEMPLQRLELPRCGLGDEDVDALRAIVDASPNLTALDIRDNHFTNAGLTRLGAVPGLNIGSQSRPIPPEWRARGLKPHELPAALSPVTQQYKWDGPDAPWEDLAPVLQRSLARGSAHLLAMAQRTTPSPSKGFVTAVTRFDKAMNARSFSIAMSRGIKATTKFERGATGALHKMARMMMWSFRSLHAAYSLDHSDDLDMGEEEWDQARQDYEVDWLFQLSNTLVQLAGCAANWEPDAPQFGFGCPDERQDQLDTWSTVTQEESGN